jgi:2-octaprenyl-6-methoxyphenol hydroxylase
MDSHDVLILGGGLVGLTLALALNAHGVSVAVIDPADPEAQLAANFDGRASAIASASWRMLDAIGVADALRPYGCPIRRIEVRDGLQPDALDFTPGEDDDPLGTMVENQRLRMALREAALKAEHITLHMPARAILIERDASGVHAALDNGRRIRASLLVAAEGRNSPTRTAAGIAIALPAPRNHLRL